MKTIDDYCDDAIKTQRFTSDRQLCRALGFSTNSVSHWRTKRTWPSDETMKALARLANVDEEQAMMDLNMWRSPPGVREIYERIAAKIAGSAAALAVVVLLTGPALAGTNPAQGNIDPTNTLYYGKLPTMHIFQIVINVNQLLLPCHRKRVRRQWEAF